MFIAWWPEAQPTGPSTLGYREERTGVLWTQERTQVRGHGEGTGPGERDEMWVKEVTVIEIGLAGNTPRKGTEMKRQYSLSGP